MSPGVKKYATGVLVLVVLSATGQMLYNRYAPPAMQVSSGFILLALFASTSILIHLFLLHSAKTPGNAFVRNFMAATTLKFLFYISILVILLLYSSDSKPAIVIHFMLYYAIFTGFEIMSLYRELNGRKKI